MEAALSPGSSRAGGIARALTVGGSSLLVIAAFLPQDSIASPLLPPDVRSAGTLWGEGIGWAMVAAGSLLGLFTIRRRVAPGSWVCLGIGVLAALNAAALGADDSFRPIGPGIVVLGLAAMPILAGWALDFAARRQWAARPSVPEPERDQAPARRTDRRAGLVAALALVGYGALSLGLWGLPVRGAFGSTLIAENSVDPSIYTWFYAWWPHALVEGLNPFVTEAIFAPDGYNLTWVTAVPGPSLLMAPVTLALSPVVTYNLLALAAPPLVAWTAFLLCRHVTGATWPSLAGGLLFGFSPYMLGMLKGSPHLYFVALIPVFVLLVVRRVEGSLSERAFFASVTVGVAAQFLTSNDVLATLSVFGAIALAAAFVLYPELRAALLRTTALLAGAYAAAAVLVSPVIFFMLFREHTTPEQNTPFFANDLVSWLLPDSSMLVAETHRPGGTDPHFGGLAYFGIPLLVLLGLYAWESGRTRSGRLLLLCFAAAALAGLGHRLTVDGDITRIGLPWAALDHLPGLELLVPQRFPLYAFLAAALMLALWLSARPGALRFALFGLVAVAMAPWVGGDYWDTPLRTPAFVESGEYGRFLDERDRVLTLPIIGDPMRWQAEDDFPFALAGGGVGAFPESYSRYPVFSTMIVGGRLPPNYGRELRRFIDDKGVTAIAVDKVFLDESRRRLFATLPVRPLDTGGVLLYRLAR